MKILALDLGIKSLGIAISDENRIVAIPKENYFFEEGDIDSAFSKVLEYLNSNDINLVLLGYPLKTTGEKATITFFIDRFNIKLNQVVKTRLVDERYSTKRSLEMLPKAKRNDFKHKKDLLAAWILLNDFLLNN